MDHIKTETKYETLASAMTYVAEAMGSYRYESVNQFEGKLFDLRNRSVLSSQPGRSGYERPKLDYHIRFSSNGTATVSHLFYFPPDICTELASKAREALKPIRSEVRIGEWNGQAFTARDPHKVATSIKALEKPYDEAIDLCKQATLEAKGLAVNQQELTKALLAAGAYGFRPHSPNEGNYVHGDSHARIALTNNGQSCRVILDFPSRHLVRLFELLKSLE